MADDSCRRSTSSRSGRLLVVALLAPAVVLHLRVPLYAREDPRSFGFPFFYWFQLSLIVAGGALTLSAHLVAGSAGRRDGVDRGLPPEPDGSGTRAHGDDLR
jgi:uncharacterized protein DUF3311